MPTGPKGEELQLAPPCAAPNPAVHRSHERKALRRHLLPE